MKGRISSFQSMGAVDGPGIRSVIFMQGCPLRCAYCHNPETWEFGGGSEATVDELVRKVDRLRPYIIKKGGVTLSGGEPTAQPEFAAELLRAFKARGYHTALDTSGIYGAAHSEVVLRYTDLVICDIKFTTQEGYAKYCHGSLAPVLEFIALAAQMKIPLWVRQVIVPGINDTAQDAAALGALARTFPNLERIELLPFRKMCAVKYENLGIDFALKDYPECPNDRAAELQKIARENG